MVDTIDREESQKELYKKKPEFEEEIKKEDPLFELRKKILHLRINKGFSQEELARKANTKQSVISRLESGDSEPKIETIHKIAKALDKELQIDLKS